MMDTYILRGHEVVSADYETWARQFETLNRRVAETIIDGFRVSTVFLGLDHRFGGAGSPLLYETMIFPPEDWGDIYCAHYMCWRKAVVGHDKACRWLRWRQRYKKRTKRRLP